MPALIYLLSELLCSLSGLCSVAPRLQSVFPGVVLITLGAWAKVLFLGYIVAMSSDPTELLLVTLTWYLPSALPSPLYFGSHLLGTCNNYTLGLFSSESQPMGETSSRTILPASLTFRIFVLLQADYSSTWEILNILNILWIPQKSAWSFSWEPACCWIWFRSCLRLNCLRMSPRDVSRVESYECVW